MKEDEIRFLLDLYNKNISPRELINQPDFYIHHKRAWYLLEKWSNKGLYDYGVTIDLGWLTTKGKKVAKELLSKWKEIKKINEI